MKVLLTGGAGYVGILLAERLLALGHEVTVLDNFMYGFEPILHLVGHERLRVVRGDIRNDDSVACVRGQEAIYHLAGISGAPACASNPHTCRMINVYGTESILRHLSPDQKVIYASTTSVYGVSKEELSETSPVAPPSEYARSKLEAETLIMRNHENSVSLRFATIYGVSPRMRGDLLVNDFAYRGVVDRALVLFEGRSKRVFLHIRDAVDAYLLALERFERARGGIFNVGTSEMNFSKKEIADAVARHTGCAVIESDLADTDPRDFRIRFDKFEGLGFKAARSLDDGLAELIKLYSFYRLQSHYRVI